MGNNCGNPSLKCFYDPTGSIQGGVGCNAGGVGQNCRFCGTGGGEPECPTLLSASPMTTTVTSTTTTLPCQAAPVTNNCGNPSLKCFYDPTCSIQGGVGCNAGGVGQNCRFCGTGGGAPECPTSLSESPMTTTMTRIAVSAAPVAGRPSAPHHCHSKWGTRQARRDKRGKVGQSQNLSYAVGPLYSCILWGQGPRQA